MYTMPRLAIDDNVGVVPDLLDVMTAGEPWRANTANRAARSRDELAELIDASVLSEALAGM